MSMKVLATTVALCVAAQCATAQWQAKGNEASATIYLPQAKKADTHAIVVLSYEKRFDCRAALSFLLVSGRQLGAAKRQASVQKGEHVVFEVDSRTFTGPGKITFYTNGMEQALFAPAGLVEAMRTAKTLIARPGEPVKGIAFPVDGFASAEASARASCR